MDKKEETLRWLTEQHIRCTLVEHDAAFTIEEMDNMNIEQSGHICKNLFLRDEKGKRHFLVSVDGHKTVNLKKLGEILGAKLSFASEERLVRYLNLTKGAVTPLGVYYDADTAVEVVLDRDLQAYGVIGVHPCVNTATVFLRYEDLVGLLRQNGNRVQVVKL